MKNGKFYRNGAGPLTGCSTNRLYVALIHHPVVDKNGETIASAVTNLDLHDIARACRTFGVGGYYVITPLEDQQELARKILSHWLTGAGGTYNPKRRQALDLVRIMGTFSEMLEEIRGAHGCLPKTVATTAKPNRANLSHERLRSMLMENKQPVALAFGTAWGLSPLFMDDVDYVLNPLVGSGAYNHLSVRSAVAIILDRLLGKR